MRLPSLRTAFIFSGSLVLVLWAANPRQPYLYALRRIEAPLLVMLALGVLIAATRLMRTGTDRSVWRQSSVAAALVAMLLGIGHDEAFRRQRQTVLGGSEALRAVGRHFVVGYRSFEETAALASRGLIGGIYLSRDFARTRSAQRIRAEVLALQTLREKAGLPPLIVAADQEGGEVAHLSPPLEPLPPLASLADSAEDLDERAFAYGTTQGSGLAALGINLNLGPVADLRPNHRRALLDTHTLLHRRAISEAPERVTRVAAGYSRGLREEGVTATFKHFPGLARTRADTHHFAATLDTHMDTLAASDWKPFREAGASGAAIMLAHVTLAAIDASRPASLSRPVVQELLRQQWHFDGLLITDDLNMGAVFRRGVCRSATEALAAGVDLVLISYDADQFYPAIKCAAAAYAAGHLNRDELKESRRRISVTAEWPMARHAERS
ncbi:MAG: glycoside hydrolase family 3 protein [Rhodocyclaceae bacterium]|nr:MAG: glycoside hydrolase family 3 protein [Rhodocyclaceae bacterium]